MRLPDGGRLLNSSTGSKRWLRRLFIRRFRRGLNNCDLVLLLIIAVYGQIDGGLIIFSCRNPNIVSLVEAVFQRGLPCVHSSQRAIR